MKALATAVLLALALCETVRASPRADLLFEINAALKARDGAAFAHCFNFQGADDATRQSLIKIISRILSWPSFDVSTSERKDGVDSKFEQDGKTFTLSGEWKYQVHISLSKSSEQAFVFPAGTVAEGKDRMLVAVPMTAKAAPAKP